MILVNVAVIRNVITGRVPEIISGVHEYGPNNIAIVIDIRNDFIICNYEFYDKI